MPCKGHFTDFLCCPSWLTWDHSGYGLSQWEKALYINTSSHWLSPYPEWSMVIPQGILLYPGLWCKFPVHHFWGYSLHVYYKAMFENCRHTWWVILTARLFSNRWIDIVIVYIECSEFLFLQNAWQDTNSKSVSLLHKSLAPYWHN